VFVLENSIAIYEYSGEGFVKQYVNAHWIVGVKNYKTASDIRFMNVLERHMLSDELFVPVFGHSVLISAEKTEFGVIFDAISMETGKIYCVPKSVWHNVVMNPEDKLILIENEGTGMENSEFLELSESDRLRLTTMWL
jgi:ureidoglycolate hydrolase